MLSRISGSLWRLLIGISLVLALSFPFKADAAENSFINAIQDRGFLRVGLPPYNTPPAYYIDPKTKELSGYDVELARSLAKKLGVEIEFDRTSKNFNSLVKRVGANDFDIAIGKLGLTYNRLFDAFPVQYLSFRHALLANRKFVSSLGVDSDDPEFASVLKNSAMRIGSISNSTWETEAKVNFPNCEFIGFSNWQEAKNALFKIDPKSKKPVIDAIYRDATEIKPIVYKDPDLSLEYVPILFDDIIDRKSIYLSEKGYVGFTDFLNVFIRREWGEVKSDQRILDDYQTFYQPSVN
jgi:polar amino acid transport system substrate-binding protein|tara:strand:- start:944 stop:1828 length:885 start_codon:yes stop_codon:yes gene_type:complete